MKKRWKTPSANFTPSRLFLYYNQRLIEGTVDSDSGSSLRSAMKVAQSVGCPHETFWPYDTTKFKVRPPGQTYYDSKFHKIQSYQSVAQTHDSVCSVLASGYPIVFGFAAFQSLESQETAKSGVIPMPGAKEEMIGGHAVLLVGYEEATKLFILRNSWGSDWGMAGYATMPYDYVLNADMADDFWTAQTIF
jgi:C1A family cysteine protease